jgi:hypothetical protein
MPDAGRLRINIVSWDSGGLTTDIDLLIDILSRAGCDVTFKGRRHRIPRNRAHSLFMTANVLLAQRLASVTGRPQFDVNLFDESIFPEYLPQARLNAMFVHPEWFRDENVPHVPRLDFLLCKTPSGVEMCRHLPAPAVNLDFTSPDKRLPGFERRGPLRCLHLAGQSAVKGSEAVVEAWSHHPEWPELVVVRRARRYGNEEAPVLPELPNVRYLTDFVSGEELQRLQNDCEVHVIPSQAEGYGHVIGEAMSCGVIVVTTDAPPMNELVAPDRGVLVEVARSEPMRLSRRSFVDVADLERKLTRVFAMPAAERAGLGRRARAWYDAQDARFRAGLVRFLVDQAGSKRAVA